MNRIRVLKLGWEFPPLINGGLGIACLGLSQALSKHVDLRVIVPRADPETRFDGFDLTGLNNLRVEDLQTVEASYRYESFAQIERVPIHLDPYDITETTVENIRMEPGGEIRFSRTTRNQLEQFKMGELHGGDLGTKVIEFSDASRVCGSEAARKDVPQEARTVRSSIGDQTTPTLGLVVEPKSS